MPSPAPQLLRVFISRLRSAFLSSSESRFHPLQRVIFIHQITKAQLPAVNPLASGNWKDNHHLRVVKSARSHWTILPDPLQCKPKSTSTYSSSTLSCIPGSPLPQPCAPSLCFSTKPERRGGRIWCAAIGSVLDSRRPQRSCQESAGRRTELPA